MVNIVIDGISIEAIEGEYILEVARKHDIFIPAICYLSKCSPTLACKMCMVEIDGKRSYACNTKAKEGMNIITNTPQIALERRAIMQSYAVNHPLECGVCDKSGECELQDFVHFCQIDSQEFFVAPSDKKMDFWGSVKYDPNLCILCERCITTCKDNVGAANLKVVKQDFAQPDSAWKESMPKDAFSVWNRAQKGVVGFVGEHACIDCAECASVCPVGALGLKSFQYTSNAWELTKTSSTCNLCPSGCKIVYESKRDIRGVRKIYRVTNDFNFNTICAGGRFGYDIYSARTQDASVFARAFNAADAINVGGNTTNEEARFLDALRENFGVNLINEELRKYGDFMDILLSRGARLAKLEDIASHKVIISLGSALKYDNPLIAYKINNALKMQKDAKFIYAHPLRDLLLEGLSKNVLSINYAPNSESALLLALAKILDEANPHLKILEQSKKMLEIKEMREVLEKTTLENGEEKEVKKRVEVASEVEFYGLFEEANISHALFCALRDMLGESKPILIAGEVFLRTDSHLSAALLGDLSREGKIDLLIIPPSANANGILQNLKLSRAPSLDAGLSSFDAGAPLLDSRAKNTIGWRTDGDFRADCVECDFEIPYFNAIDDTITNLDYRILPLRAFDKPSDYLNALARALNIEFAPQTEHYCNDFGNDGSDNRGKVVMPSAKNSADSALDSDSNANLSANANLSTNANLSAAQKPNAYLRDASAHFYPYTRFSRQFQTKIGIYVSSEIFQSLRDARLLGEGDEIVLEREDAQNREARQNDAQNRDARRTRQSKIRAQVFVDYEMKGEFFAISPQIRGAREIFKGAKYARVKVVK